MRVNPLVLLPGLLGNARELRRLRDRLAVEREVRIVEAPPSADWEGPLAALEAATADRTGPFDLLGLSLGGLWAQRFVARHPARVDRVVLAVTGPGAGPRERLLLANTQALLRNEAVGAGEVATRVVLDLASPTFLGRAGAASYLSDELRTRLENPGVRAGAAEQLTLALTHGLEEARAVAGRVSRVIAAGHDWIFPPGQGRRLAELVGAPCEVLPEIGHLAWLEDLPGFTAAVRRGLEG